MKPIELFQYFGVFKDAMVSTDVPEEIKLQVAREFITSLPPKAFSASCPATRAWLECAVQAVIDKLEAEANARTEAGPKDAGTKKERSKGKAA